MSQYASEFSNDKIGLQLASQIPWFTIIIIASEFGQVEFGQQIADQLIPWFTLVEIVYKSKYHEEMLINL